MKKSCQKLFIISSLLLSTQALYAQRNICDVYGSIYFTESIRDAHYRVFQESSEVFADIVIFKEENELFADQQGKWHIVDEQAFADFRVFLTTNKRDADFTIHYTDTESFAGCND